MAFVGLMYALFAPIEKEIAYQPIQYKSGAAVVVGKMIGADVTFNRDTNKLYSNDAECESDNSITGGTLTLNLDDVSEETEVVILGTVKASDTLNEKQIDVYQEVGDASPYGGFGYVRVRRKEGVISYQANWLHKTQLGISTENAATKGQSITWQTPSLTGPIMAVKNSDDKKIHFRDKARFDNEEDAIAWINKRGGYTGAAS